MLLTFQLLEGVYLARVTTMKIQDFSKRTGVPAKTIRYYEEIGLLPAQPARKTIIVSIPNKILSVCVSSLDRVSLIFR